MKYLIMQNVQKQKLAQRETKTIVESLQEVLAVKLVQYPYNNHI